MKVSRLDKIIENNVTYSTQKANQEQAVYILQDISATLAMIYDRLCGLSHVSDTSMSLSSFATVIPFHDLNKYETMHFETDDYAEGYEVSFKNYGQSEEIDAKKNTIKTNEYAILNCFGEEMKLYENKYGKTWRCWTIKPTEEERKKVKWTK